ncbi:rab11 family-interacting protein 5 [Eudromia elegans]
MALLRAASALPAEEAPCWLPTHVQVTVLRARGLRCKGGGGGGGRAGTSDAYAVLQLGREQYRTAVAEKSAGEAEWREECALELPAAPAARRLRLTVLHRALLGADRFLGRAEVPLEPARAPDTRWHKLHSKPGKKEKERGEIQVSIQFTRHNLTASMFDLSMKEKPRSPFGKLKDKVRGKKKYDLESASAIIPSSVGALDEDDDDDVGGRKAKVKGFFLKSKLRKSSLSQSNTSLGSDSTVSSASLGMAGGLPEGAKSPSRHGSLSTEHSGRDAPLSADGCGPSEAGGAPAARAALCINGSHVYGAEAAPRSPGGPRRAHENLGFVPLHAEPREVPWPGGSFPRAQQRDEPRFIPSPPTLALQEELRVSTKAVTLSNHLGRARMEENSRFESKAAPGAAATLCSAEGTAANAAEEARRDERRGKGSTSQHGDSRGDAGGHGEKVGASRSSPTQAAAAGGDERSKPSGWFGSKEPPQKGSFPPGPHASTELAGSFYSSEDPSASERVRDPEREPPAQSVCFPVPETTPPAQGDLVAPHEEPAAPAALPEWDDTFDAFASSRLKPEARREPAPASVEPLAFIDDPDAARGDGTEAFVEADPPLTREVPPSLRSWADYPGLDVGANLVSTTQEATVIEDVLSPVSAGSVARRKSSTPAVWAPIFALGNSGEKGVSAQRTAENTAGEEGESNEEELGGAGQNGWMTIATETAPEAAGEAFEQERSDAVGALAQQAPLGEGPSEEQDGPRMAPALPQGGARAASPSEAAAGSNVAAVPPRVLAASRGAGGREPLRVRPSVLQLQEGDAPPKPPRWFAAAGEGGNEDDSPGARSEFPLHGEAGSAAEERAERRSPAPEQPLEGSGSDVAEFESCPSRFSAEASAASPPEPQPLLPSGRSPSSEVDSGRAETFWTALEEQEVAAPARPRALVRGELPPGCRGEGHREPEAPPGHGRSAGRGLDFKTADFWRADGAEDGRERDAPARGNPFAAALSPSAPTNPFVERPPDALPVQAVLPERPARGGLSSAALREEAPPPASQAANLPPEPPPFPHASQPLASSTPFPAAATNPEPFDFPAPAVHDGVATGHAAARPGPGLQPGDSQASALLVLPRETQPAGKPLWQQTSSPHAVRPLGAAERPQPRTGLAGALGSGLDKLRAATTSSVQPVASVSHLETTDSKKLKDPTVPDQSAKYYHLTHDELIQLLLQREKELSRKEEHIRELEDYIDQLLVRIMEQSPTLLQIPLGQGKGK